MLLIALRDVWPIMESFYCSSGDYKYIIIVQLAPRQRDIMLTQWSLKGGVVFLFLMSEQYVKIQVYVYAHKDFFSILDELFYIRLFKPHPLPS